MELYDEDDDACNILKVRKNSIWSLSTAIVVEIHTPLFTMCKIAWGEDSDKDNSSNTESHTAGSERGTESGGSQQMSILRELYPEK